MKKIIIIISFLIIITFTIIYTSKSNSKTNNNTQMPSLTSLQELSSFQKKYPNINISITYKYDANPKDTIINQSIPPNTNITTQTNLEITISTGPFNTEKMQKDNIDELGKIPIMMYHSIVNIPSQETSYTGGNVDKEGYTRTTEAFTEDLEFYYQNNYRMISLKDYIEGNINVPYKTSPIILTFDDGNENNIKVTGLDSEGNIIIDPNSAVGILEKFKTKYPDYNVTATFFINENLFNQEEYNTKIIKWLIENNYDIGNHTKGHIDIKSETKENVSTSVGYIYNMLDQIIPNQYLNIVALPYGSPYKKEHENFNYVLSSTYNNINYTTISTLRVGWEPELSPYDKEFDKTFLKRCRAYDNNGKEFDIEMTFKNLETTRYISDGIADTIVIPCEKEQNLSQTNKEIKCY